MWKWHDILLIFAAIFIALAIYCVIAVLVVANQKP